MVMHKERGRPAYYMVAMVAIVESRLAGVREIPHRALSIDFLSSQGFNTGQLAKKLGRFRVKSNVILHFHVSPALPLCRETAPYNCSPIEPSAYHFSSSVN